MNSIYRALDGLDGFGAPASDSNQNKVAAPGAETPELAEAKKRGGQFKKKLEAERARADAAIEKNRAAMDGQLNALTTKLENAKDAISTPVAVIGGVLVGGVIIAAIGALVTSVRKKNPRKRRSGGTRRKYGGRR